jgi:hypothetical protein
MQSSIAQWRDTVFFYFRKIIPKELDKKEKPKERGEKGRFWSFWNHQNRNSL